MQEIEDFFKIIDGAKISVREFAEKSGRDQAAINRWRSTGRANRKLVLAASIDAHKQVLEKIEELKKISSTATTGE